jgi:murein DD-endopeptidase MepM/ murein hydrolase activator NlpD
MKQFYFFSKNKLKFVEIRNFYRKYVFLVIFSATLISFLIFGTFFLINEIINPDAKLKDLKTENRALAEKLSQALNKFEEFDGELEKLRKENNYLRLSVNLDPIDSADFEIGTGGSVFDDIPVSNSEDIANVVNALNSKISRVTSELTFEKNNFSEIKSTFERNKLLYDAIPAIKPAVGPFGDRFGMRRHPILKIRRMHTGVDILVNTGTDVYATGKGKVVYAGRRGGYGRIVEIDHGFGYKTIYAHLRKILVRRGQKVNRGDKIALSGNSGKLSTGPHLHYEVRHNGIPLNPRNFIFDDVNIFDIVKN